MTWTCASCRFSDFQVVDTIDQEGDHGDMPHRVCRRFPPPMVGYEDAAGAVWPIVHDADWCGEFAFAPPTAGSEVQP